MSRALIWALAISGFAATAQAADLGGMKDPLPDALTYKGVTLYGTIDVGYAYQTNGAPYSGALYTGLDYNIFGSKQNRETISSLTNSALSQSFIGVKVEENLGGGWVALAKLETAFSPLSGEIGDVCQSMIRNNGRPLTQATSSGDGSRCGQAINGPAYAGLSNAGYGTLMIGRQNTLDLELVANYDPMGASYAFSLIGWSGGAGPGTGSTETARWDNSIKYLYQYGPVHVGAMYAVGAEDSSIFNSAYAFNAGGTYKGFSVDVVYTKENGAFNAGAPYPYQGAGTCGVAGMPACNTLTGNFEDNEAWTIAGKYVYDFGGGWKDEGPAAKLTLYGGYQHTNISNPGNPIGITGNTTIGGYPLFFTSFAAANQVFTTDKVIQTEWVGAKYELPSGWSFTGAYYHLDQNSFVKSGAACVPGSGTHASSNCAGDTNTVSGLVDYAFNKHFDVYGGVAWSDVSGGLASGFLATENTTVVTGMRLKF